MKQYFQFFKWIYIVLGVIIALYLFLLGGHAALAKMSYYDRLNEDCTTDERVFDYADVLTDKEEEKLRKLIDKRQKQTGCDIVLVTLDEPLEEYATAIDPWVSSRSTCGCTPSSSMKSAIWDTTSRTATA